MPSLADRLREMEATGGNTEEVKISLQSHQPQPLKVFFPHCYFPNGFERAKAHFGEFGVSQFLEMRSIEMNPVGALR